MGFSVLALAGDYRLCFYEDSQWTREGEAAKTGSLLLFHPSRVQQWLQGHITDALLASQPACWCSSCCSSCCSCCLEDLMEESSNHIENCVWWPGSLDTCRSVLTLFKKFFHLQLLFLSIDLAPAATFWGVGMGRSLEILRFLYPQVCSVPCPSINDFSTV